MPQSNVNLRLLVPLDGSLQAEAALPFARTLAAGNGEIIVLRVVADQEPPYITAGLFKTPHRGGVRVPGG